MKQGIGSVRRDLVEALKSAREAGTCRLSQKLYLAYVRAGRREAFARDDTPGFRGKV